MPKLIVVLPLLAMASCTDAKVSEQPLPERTTARHGMLAKASGNAVSTHSVSGGAKAIARSDDLAEFKLSYPAAIGAIPTLARMIEEQAEAAEAEMQQAARSDREAATKAGYTFRPHMVSFEWKVVADLPRFLSVSNSFAAYTGGAHGGYGVSGLVWDKEGQRALTGTELFVSASALQHALGKRFCDALDAQRRERRGGDGKVGGEFDECPPVSDMTILVGSSNGRTFNRLTLYAGPYVAGPYAEGAYEVDLPVDAAVFAAVKPEYRHAFSTVR